MSLRTKADLSQQGSWSITASVENAIKVAQLAVYHLPVRARVVFVFSASIPPSPRETQHVPGIKPNPSGGGDQGEGAVRPGGREGFFCSKVPKGLMNG